MLAIPLLLTAAACDSGGGNADSGDAGGEETNDAPTAEFSYTPQSPTVGTSVTFDASASTDEDGSIASYEWSFENDETATGQTTSRVYTESVENKYGADSRYEVTLTVTDDAGATATTSKVITIPPPSREVSWTQVWGDEFEGDGLPDAAKWYYETGGDGWGNQEKQYYTEKDPDNARLENGNLVIEARKESYQGNAYTSARLNSEESWTYGRFEIKAKLPSGRGTWPALWMLPDKSTYGTQYWPDNGEIDIMEHVGYDPGVIHGTIHTKAFNHIQGTDRGGSIEVTDAMETFHVYAMEWTPNEIRVYVDGKKYFTFRNQPQYDWQEWPFDQKFHLLFNIAVGGTWGGAEGIDDSAFPTQMVVDYVRVYKPE
jgi:licheninase